MITIEDFRNLYKDNGRQRKRNNGHSVSISFAKPLPYCKISWEEAQEILKLNSQEREFKQASVSFKRQGPLLPLGQTKVANDETRKNYLTLFVSSYAKDTEELKGIFAQARIRQLTWSS